MNWIYHSIHTTWAIDPLHMSDSDRSDIDIEDR